MRMGLAANALHHDHDDAALFRWLRACEQGIRELNLRIHAVGRTHAAIERVGYLDLERFFFGIHCQRDLAD